LKNRPTGIIILATLSIIGGIINILAGLGLGIFGGAASLLGVVALIIGILKLIYGWGLWTLQSWSWLLAVIGSALSLLQGLYGIISGGNVGDGILAVIIARIILWYLYRPTVRSAFVHPRRI
jgi:uncharacterized membrane protein (DUF2068 family)